ncbi:hypothetical protein GCM10027341_07710 [Spirosoma knui]
MKTMTRSNANRIKHGLLTGLLVSASLTVWSCSGNKENNSESTSTSTMSDSANTTADSSVFGRQGDTLNSSSMDAPQQAPPDSASARGAVVPAEVKVKVKK